MGNGAQFSNLIFPEVTDQVTKQSPAQLSPSAEGETIHHTVSKLQPHRQVHLVYLTKRSVLQHVCQSSPPAACDFKRTLGEIHPGCWSPSWHEGD